MAEEHTKTGDDPTDPAGPDPSNTPPANGPAGDQPKDQDPASPGNGPTDDPADDPADDDPSGDDPADGDGAAVKRANRQAAGYRTKLREEEQARQRIETELAEAKTAAGERDELKTVLDGLRKVLDPNAKEDEPVDPEELTRRYEAERSEWETEKSGLQGQVRELRVQNTLPDAFRDAKVDPSLTLAVLKSEGTLAKLDPDADSYGDDVKAAVAKAAEKNPGLKVKEGPRRSGTEPTGPSSNTDQLTLEQYKKLAPDEAVKAQREGRLRNILGG